jgi:histidyl-tRNA synthetase
MSGKSKQTKLQAPKGTRDLYPEDVLKRRYIQNAWRDASLRCGFDEIEGPTFESTELYSVKSGEGILGELFQAYSGKSPNEVEQVQETGRAPYALRPEFTPTLARMYAAHAKQLPRPCKWFTAGPYFRAERPQRGRLREFLQWNVDVIGLPGEGDSSEAKAQMDAETIECCVRLLDNLGISESQAKIHISERDFITTALNYCGVKQSQVQDVLVLLDKRSKLPESKFREQVYESRFELDIQRFDHTLSVLVKNFNRDLGSTRLRKTNRKFGIGELFKAMEGKQSKDFTFDEIVETASEFAENYDEESVARTFSFFDFQNMLDGIDTSCGSGWYEFDPSIVRGLAYYTGTVFEALADGERAVAGGGRYDKLIELMGGPPTPAVGFAMGDVVLGNLLEDKGLMPQGAELMEAAARPQASIRPEAFVVPNGDDDNEALVHTLVANLRRGVESEQWRLRDERKPWDRDRYSVRPLHARVSYKSTRNLGKLRADAEKQHAKFFVEIHADNKVLITDMDKRESITSDVGSFHVDPSADNYVGRVITELTR